MKKTLMFVIGMCLIVATYQHTRRQTEYLTAQSALTNQPTYVASPAPMPVSLKNTLAFRLIKPS